MFFVVGFVSEDTLDYPTEGQYPTTTPSGKQNPLVHSDTTHSLAPALFYCIRATTIHLLLDAVVEPLILCMTCHCHSK